MGKVLEGKVAVVTGSGQGIGRSCALAFAAQGAKVVTNNRKPGVSPASMVTEEQINKLPDDKKEWYKKGFADVTGDAETTAKTIREMGGEATPVFADITKPEDANRLIQTAIDTYGRIDILCNVAGGFGFSDIEDITDEMWFRVTTVKPQGYFFTMRAAIPHMRKQKSGRIILCTSGAFGGGPLKQAAYSTANAGVLGLANAAAGELRADGITVNCFAPGALTRASYELEAARATHDKGILVKGKNFVSADDTPGPEYVAPFVVYLASEKSEQFSGAVFFVMGNRVAMYGRQVQEKSIIKEATEPWEFNELAAKVESDFLPGYKSFVDM